MKLLIAAGGTGGHIFPGLAVAEAFIAADAANKVFFVGTPHGMEGRIIPGLRIPPAHDRCTSVPGTKYAPEDG